MGFNIPTLLTALLTASSVLAAPSGFNSPAAFTLVALYTDDTNTTHNGVINAYWQHFYINRPTSSHCPTIYQSRGECPPGNVTALSTGPFASLYMSTMVPGGQQVYVDYISLKYSVPRSGTIPASAQRKSFTYTPGEPGYFGRLEYSEGKFMACPQLGDGVDGTNPYLIQINYDGWPMHWGCFGIEIGTVPFEAPGAWEYVP